MSQSQLPTAPVQQVVYVQGDKYQVGIAYLLLVFFGFMGAHRFYVGKIGTGFLYLLTFGLLGFGILWDVFFLARQVRVENDLARR